MKGVLTFFTAIEGPTVVCGASRALYFPHLSKITEETASTLVVHLIQKLGPTRSVSHVGDEDTGFWVFIG